MIRSFYLIGIVTLQCCLAFNMPQQPILLTSLSGRLGNGVSVGRSMEETSPSTFDTRRYPPCTDHSRLQIFTRTTALQAISDENKSEESSANSCNNKVNRDPLTSKDRVGGYDPMRDKLPLERETANVGAPQQTMEVQSMNITKVLTELQAIQSQGPKKYCILGTRHCSFLHQQIVEML